MNGFDRRPLLSAFAFALATVASLSPARPAAARVEIDHDTVWEGTVDAGDGVRVLKGATLLVLPGTTVRFATVKDEGGQPTAQLHVKGTLIAQGTPDRPITFTSSSGEPRAGDWAGIAFENSGQRTNRLRHVTIRHASVGLSASHTILMVEDTVLRDNLTGFGTYQDVSGWMFGGAVTGNEIGMHFNQTPGFPVENVEIRGNRQVGVLCVLNSSPAIRNCTIADNGENGIRLVQGSSPLVEGNTIRGSRHGIFMELQTRPRIVRNAITGNETGIWGEKMVVPTVEGNVITANGTGIYCNYSAYMQIHGNNLHDNRGFALVVGDNMSILMQVKIPFRHLGRFAFDAGAVGEEKVPHQSRKYEPFPENAGVVDARDNWWGTAATAEMERLGPDGNVSAIEDFFDKPDTFYGEEVYRRDRVAYSPWAKGPLAEAGPGPRRYTGVRGRVLIGGKPVAGVRVHTYHDAQSGLRGEGSYYSAPTAADGSFSLNIPAAPVYLVAKGPEPPFPYGEPGPGEIYGFAGANPIAMRADSFTTIDIPAVRRVAPLVTPGPDPALARVEGVVLGPAGPVAGASVDVYANGEQQFRGPGGAAAGRTDASGSFAIDLPPGWYFLVASKRAGGEPGSAPRPGDLHGFYDGNPVELVAGSKTAITLQAVEVSEPQAERP